MTRTFLQQKFSVTHFLAIFPNFCAWRMRGVERGQGEGSRGGRGVVGYDWNFLMMSAFLSSNRYMALIFEPLVQFEWINLHWKVNMFFFSNIMGLITFYVFFCWCQQFFIIFKKNKSCGIIQPHWTHLMFLVYLLATNVLSVCRSLKKLKNEGSTMFRGLAVQKLEKKNFSVKIWIIIKKICLCQQKMNGNDAINFWYFGRTTQYLSNKW